MNSKPPSRVSSIVPKVHRDKVQLCLWVTPEQDRKLRARAERDEAPISDVVRRAVDAYLEKRP